MDKILGNYLTQGNRNFPLDCETLDYMQTNAAMLSALGNIGGDKIILSGCALTGGVRAEGYVFVRTSAAPEGEVLRFEGGAESAGMYVKSDAIAVSTDVSTYPTAYTRRTLAAGVGAENFVWADFSAVDTNRALKAKVDDLIAAVALLAPPPLGIVQMFSGPASAVPSGYALCDGRALSRVDYPLLYNLFGDMYGSVEGLLFRIPDMRDRFVVGYNPGSRKTNKAVGGTGGQDSVTLSLEEMPSHSHNVDDYYYIESQNSATESLYGSFLLDHSTTGSGDTDRDNNKLLYVPHSSDYVGGNMSHENRPPFFTVAYIIRLA